MTLEYNVGASILDAARRFKDRIAFHAPDGNLTYEQVGRIIAAMIFVLRNNGVGRGSCVSLRLWDPRATICAISACSAIGAAWTSANLGESEENRSLATHTLADPRRLPKRETPGQLVLFEPRMVNPAQAMAALNTMPPTGFASVDDLSRIGWSSGTTGEAKPIHITAIDEWNRSAWLPSSEFQNRPMTSFCLFPPMGGVGANTRLRTLMSGGMNIEGISRENAAKGMISQVVGSPSHMAKFYKDFPSSELKKKISYAFVGGGKPGSVMLERLRQSFENIYIFYGSTEIGSTAGYAGAESLDYDGRLQPIDSLVDVEIVDVAGNKVPIGTQGVVRVRGKYGSPHYINNDEANAKSFVNGWFYPGDLGRMTEEGYLYIEGRTGDIANVGGVKINVLQYDDFIQNVPGIIDGYCFVSPNDLGVDRLNFIAKFEDGADVDETVRGLVAKMAEHSSFRIPAAALYKVNDVPRTDTGKPRRRDAITLAADLTPIPVYAIYQELMRSLSEHETMTATDA